MACTPRLRHCFGFGSQKWHRHLNATRWRNRNPQKSNKFTPPLGRLGARVFSCGGLVKSSIVCPFLSCTIFARPVFASLAITCMCQDFP